MNLTFYLFNETVVDFDGAIDQTKIDPDDGFKEIKLIDDLPFTARAYFQQNKKTKPKWLDFISEFVVINPEDIYNSSNSFLILIKCQERVFAVTKGFGFSALKRKKFERGFGLRVVLNEIDPQKIKSVDVRKIDTTTKQKRVFLTRNSPLYDFDFDIDEDLVNLLSGQPADTAFARKLMGADSLTLTADIGFLDLGDKCTQLLSAFKKDTYRQNFAFVDYLQVVKDDLVIHALEGVLLSRLTARDNDKLLLAYPEIPDFEQIERFKVWQRYDNTYLDEIDLRQVYDFLEENGLDVDLLNTYIIGLDHNDLPVTKKYNLKDFVVFETTYNGSRYLLSLNQWFEIASDYVDEINKELGNIEEILGDFLPPMQYGQREDVYNESTAAARADLAIFDKNNYQVDSHGKVEVCDLLSVNSDFICVKKYNGSSTLSHLFNQGFVSATLLNDDPSYRKFIIDNCPNDFGEVAFDEIKVTKENITFVFAIATDTPGSLAQGLPFFSKVNLIKANKSISRMGFKVKLNKIQII